jgi:hypothetical protein
MQLPHVKKFDIGAFGTHRLLNIDLNEGGAEFIAHNLQNLNTLNIGNRWSNSENNSIGDAGAIAIANGIKNLTYLDIRKE